MFTVVSIGGFAVRDRAASAVRTGNAGGGSCCRLEAERGLAPALPPCVGDGIPESGCRFRKSLVHWGHLERSALRKHFFPAVRARGNSSLGRQLPQNEEAFASNPDFSRDATAASEAAQSAHFYSSTMRGIACGAQMAS